MDNSLATGATVDRNMDELMRGHVGIQPIYSNDIEHRDSDMDSHEHHLISKYHTTSNETLNLQVLIGTRRSRVWKLRL